MDNISYNIAFTGEIADGQDSIEVKNKIAALMKKTDNIDDLFSGKEFIIRRNLGYSNALKFKTSFEKKTGAKCRIVSAEKTTEIHNNNPELKRTTVHALDENQKSLNGENDDKAHGNIHHCPQCHFSSTYRFDECPKCGIIISKIKAKSDLMDLKLKESNIPTSPRTESRKPKVLYTIAAAIFTIILLVFFTHFLRQKPKETSKVTAHEPQIASLPTLPPFEKPTQDAMAFLEKKAELMESYRFVEGQYPENVVLSFFALGEFINKKDSPNSLESWAHRQRNNLRKYTMTVLSNDLERMKAAGDFRAQFFALAGLINAMEGGENTVNIQDPEEILKATTDMQPYLEDLKETINEAKSLQTSENDIWDVTIEEAKLMARYEEKIGLNTAYMSAPENSMLLHVKGKVTNKSKTPDPSYATWIHGLLQSSFICIDEKIYKNGHVPENKRLMSHYSFLVISPSGQYQCSVVGKESDFMSDVMLFVRSLAKESNPTLSSGKFLKQGESCRFDLCFSVPKNEKNFSLLIWGNAPITIPLNEL